MTPNIDWEATDDVSTMFADASQRCSVTMA